MSVWVYCGVDLKQFKQNTRKEIERDEKEWRKESERDRGRERKRTKTHSTTRRAIAVHAQGAIFAVC